MEFMTWNPSYSVKVKACDDDHKKLFAMINTLHDAMKAGHGADKVAGIVQELGSYARYHFDREEALLEKAKYPDLPSHRAQHHAFIQRVEQFRKDLVAGQGGQSVAVAEFMNQWLTGHIRQIDQKYSSHLNSHGIS